MSDGTVHGGAVNHGTGGMTGPAGMPGAPGVTGGTRGGWIVVLVCGVLPAALLAVIVAVPAALWSRLPARVADHWTLAGTANGTAPPLVSFAALGLIAVLGAALVCLGLVSARKRTPRPGYSAGVSPAARRRQAAGGALGSVSVGLFLMAVSAASVVLVAVANLGGGGLRSASVSAASPVAIVGGRPCSLLSPATCCAATAGSAGQTTGHPGQAWGCGRANGPCGPGGRAPGGRGRPRPCWWPRVRSPAS